MADRPKRPKVVYGLIAGALLFAALSLLATTRSTEFVGPRDIVMVGENRLWLPIGDNIHVLDGDGRLQHSFPIASLNIPSSLNSIERMPDGNVIVAAIGAVDWPVVDATNGKVLRRIRPAAASTRAMLLDTYQLAVAPNGDMAVATSGNHTVILLDADGADKAVSKPGLFRFANALWFAPEGLWVVDTNRYQLRLLDAATLQPIREIKLEDTESAARLPSFPRPSAAPGHFVTVSRMYNGMTVGRIVDIDASGQERVEYQLPDDAEPGEFTWWRGRLIAMDSAHHQVNAFRPDGTIDAPFGDTTVQAMLDYTRSNATLWTRVRVFSQIAAITCLVVGLYLYMKRKNAGAALPVDAAHPVLSRTPLLTPREILASLPRQAKLSIWIFLASIILMVLTPVFIEPGLKRTPVIAVIGLLNVAIIISAVLLFRGLRQARGDMTSEAFANQIAIALLHKHRLLWQRELQAGERALECLLLFNWTRVHWLLLTDRRLLVFARNILDIKLQRSLGRNEIAGAESGLSQTSNGWLGRWRKIFNTELRINVTDATVLRGWVQSPTTAQRVVSQLNEKISSVAAVVRPSLSLGRKSISGAPQTPAQQCINAMLSGLVPGLGQFRQRRFNSGLLFFAAGAFFFTFMVLPVLWTLLGKHADVSVRVTIQAFVYQALAHLISAFDAWNGQPNK